VAIEGEKVATVVATLIAGLEQKYAEDETAEVTAVVVLAAVEHSGGQAATVHYDASPGVARHVGIGMLEQTKHRLLS
jgi:hypothetical protein